jgi:hypothetical protein
MNPIPPSASPAFARATAMAAVLFASLCAATPAFAADLVTEARPVGAFKSVRLIGSADLVLTQADTPALSVEADKNTLQYLKTEVRGDELTLIYDPGSGIHWFSSGKGPRFLLSAKSLDRLSTSGSGDVKSDSFTIPGDFEISVSGSSDVQFGALAARKLLVRITGSGDVQLAGGVLEQNVRIAGSGDYRSGALQSASATIQIGGSGDATLWARDNLSIKIAGSGDVKYYGRPTISKSIAGSGSVTGLGDKP